MSRRDIEAEMPFEFDSDGFLTERVGEFERDIYDTHRDLFDRARQINRDCHDLLFSADVRNRDGEAVVVGTLFIRILEQYQATIILLQRGLIASARVALRSLVESTFKVRSIVDNAGLFKDFISEDLLHRKKLIRKTKEKPYPNLEAARAAITNELIEEIDKEIALTGARLRTSEEWSKLAGMHDWYITNYALLSKSVHTQVRELEDYISIGDSGEFSQFDYAPSLDEIPLLTLTAFHCVLIAASAFDKRFELGFGLKGQSHADFVESGLRIIDRKYRPGSEEEDRRQSRVVAEADAADRDLGEFLDAALADLDDEGRA